MEFSGSLNGVNSSERVKGHAHAQESVHRELRYMRSNIRYLVA